MGISQQSDQMSKNIQNSLASKLQDYSTTFRKAQSKYLKRLRKQETQGAAKTFDIKTEEDEEDLDAVFTDAQMAVVNANDHAISQREKEINEIAKSIMTLADIFRELQTMVLFIN
jgi:syntaxin 16